MADLKESRKLARHGSIDGWVDVAPSAGRQRKPSIDSTSSWCMDLDESEDWVVAPDASDMIELPVPPVFHMHSRRSSMSSWDGEGFEDEVKRPQEEEPQAGQVNEQPIGCGEEGSSKQHATAQSNEAAQWACDRCTFLNHPLMSSCEICNHNPTLVRPKIADYSVPQFRSSFATVVREASSSANERKQTPLATQNTRKPIYMRVPRVRPNAGIAFMAKCNHTLARSLLGTGPSRPCGVSRHSKQMQTKKLSLPTIEGIPEEVDMNEFEEDHQSEEEESEAEIDIQAVSLEEEEDEISSEEELPHSIHV